MDEYIGREKLLKQIKDLPTWWEDAGGVYGHAMKYPDGTFDVEDVVNLIANAPAADVAPVVHGRWDDSFDGITPFCSVCKMTHNCLNRLPDYCPHCGAKMDGGDTP